MNKTEIIEKIEQGKIKMYEIENYFDKTESVEIRRIYIERQTGKKFDSIGSFTFDPNNVYGKNCENVIGGATLPIGIAGPLKVISDNANGEYYVPIATTEGALVASINRGAKTVSLSGGVNVISEYVGITRAPVFQVANIKEAKKFKIWFAKNYDLVKKIGEATDQYLDVIGYKIYTFGKNVWIRFNFDTKDAMGMNMAVVATQQMCDYIESKYKNIRTIAVSGNMCTDKKPALINSIEGRGRIIEAEAIIPNQILKKYLKTTADAIAEVNHIKTWMGSALAGSIGFNAHSANMVAGIFIATGQDPAHIVSTSMSYTNIESINNDLHINVKIPSLNVATVGGGTKLATQMECCDLMLTNTSSTLKEKRNINKTDKLAEITGACVLAGELSLHAAFASKNFVQAHQKYGRSTP
jgi:hydroxymethylglutaryl-CoA reductase (NADPH)